MRIVGVMILLIAIPVSAEAGRAQLFDKMMQGCKEYVLSNKKITQSFFRAGLKMGDVCECGSMLFVGELTPFQTQEIEEMGALTKRLIDRNQTLLSDCARNGFDSSLR